ncbi:MAG: hypothetical protein QM612_09475 [Thermomonas sp.]|uniref:hypothetical protein n=1 Tax=Thermomonas sp. TaxID=1971895 RepID=UPI0039E5F64B
MHRLLIVTAMLALGSGCASATNDPTTSTPASQPATASMQTPETPASTAASKTLTLDLGQQATLDDGSKLTYERLVDDSRCPPGVQCIWAGNAEIALRWKPKSGAAQTQSLHTSSRGGQTEASFGPYRVRIQSLARGIAPNVTLDITTTL